MNINDIIPMKKKRRRSRPMPFRDRFRTLPITPRRVAEAVVEENGSFAGIEVDGVQFKPSIRFLKGLALRMKVSLSVFELFTPLEVVRRAAKRAPDLRPTKTVS